MAAYTYDGYCLFVTCGDYSVQCLDSVYLAFMRAVSAGREKRAWYLAFAHAPN